MTERRVPPLLLVLSVLLDGTLLAFFLFMPRTGLETLAFTYVAFPLSLLRAGLGFACLYLAAKRGAWGTALYTSGALALLLWLWFVGMRLEPTYEPLHEALRRQMTDRAAAAESRVRTLAYDRRRAEQTEADPDHGRLCDLMAIERDLDALRAHPLRSVDRPCTTLRGAEVSPLLHAISYTYGAWSGGEIPHAPRDEHFLAPATELLLAAGADPDLQDEYGNTALHYALTFRNEALLDVLLAGGACLLVPDARGATPLRTHSDGSLRRKVDAAAADPAMLARCGAVPGVPVAPSNPADEAALPPNAMLLRALRSGDLQGAIEALEQGADPDARDHQDSSLRAALRNCRDNAPTLVQLLLDAGADIDRVDQREHTALRIAFDHCRRALPFLLEQGADPAVGDRRGDVLLHLLSSTSEAGLVPLLDELLDAGADIDQANRAGQTPLMRGVIGGRADVVVALLARGADAERTDGGGSTVLHLLARRGTDAEVAAVLPALLVQGVELERPDGQGRTPLAIAVEDGRPATVRALIDAGANIEVQRSRGAPLISGLLSCDPEDLENLDALLTAGADPQARTEHGPLPLARALLNHLFLDCLEPAQMLLEAGAEPNMRDRNGGVPIHSIAYWTEKDPDAALTLMESHGAEIDLRNDQGLTALLLSARGGTSERTLQRLVEHGAALDARDERDNTVLHHLADNREAGVERLIAWALSQGADRSLRNDRGETALERARRHRNPAAVQALEGR